MLWYIARNSLASKFGTRTVVIASVMIGPHSLGVARRVKIRRKGDPSLSRTMKRLSVDWVYSQTCFSLASRPPRIGSDQWAPGVSLALRVKNISIVAICATVIFPSEMTM